MVSLNLAMSGFGAPLSETESGNKMRFVAAGIARVASYNSRIESHG